MPVGRARLAVAAGAGVDQQAEAVGLAVARREGAERPGIAQPLGAGAQLELVRRRRLEARGVEAPEQAARVGHHARHLDAADAQRRQRGGLGAQRDLDQEAGVARGRQQVADLTGVPTVVAGCEREATRGAPSARLAASAPPPRRKSRRLIDAARPALIAAASARSTCCISSGVSFHCRRLDVRRHLLRLGGAGDDARGAAGWRAATTPRARGWS